MGTHQAADMGKELEVHTQYVTPVLVRCQSTACKASPCRRYRELLWEGADTPHTTHQLLSPVRLSASDAPHPAGCSNSGAAWTALL
jgi:hypothetical protein